MPGKAPRWRTLTGCCAAAVADPFLIWLTNPDWRCCPLLPTEPPAPPPAEPHPPRPSRLGVAHHEARDWKHDPVRRASTLDRVPGAALVTRS